jgi:enoyl-CoA hydratase/carnithine racemase
VSPVASPSAWRRETTAEGIRTLWFDRPGSSQNSLDVAALDELSTVVGEIAADGSAANVVVRSAKAKGFCAGADLRQIGGYQTHAEAEELCRRGLSAFDQLSALQIPTIALIHGTCLGGGLELALACKYRLAVVGGPVAASLGAPEVRIGLIPGWDAIAALPRRIGLAAALPLLLSGSAVSADEAKHLGMVDDTLDSGGLESGLARFLAAPRSATRPPWPPADASETLMDARRRLDTSPSGATKAQLRLLECVESDLARGHAAGRAAAIAGLAELAILPETRAAIAAIFKR